MPSTPARAVPLSEPAAADAAPLGLREQGKSNTRAAILEKSLSLFAARGYDAVTTQEIAAEAGVTQRTLFRYFPRKDAIVYESGYNYVRRFEAYLDEALAGPADPFDAVCAAFGRLSLYFGENRRVISTLYAIIETSDQLKAIERAQQLRIDALAAWALDGREAYRRREGQPSLAARIAASVVFGAVRPMHRAWLKGELSGDLDAYARISLAELGPVYEAARGYAETMAEAFAAVAPKTRP